MVISLAVGSWQSAVGSQQSAVGSQQSAVSSQSVFSQQSSVYQSVSLSVCQSISLSVYQSVSLSVNSREIMREALEILRVMNYEFRVMNILISQYLNIPPSLRIRRAKQYLNSQPSQQSAPDIPCQSHQTDYTHCYQRPAHPSPLHF